MNKYARLKLDLEKSGTGSMKCFGNSMLPILTSGTTCTFISEKTYHVGDIVFCKVKGRYIDAHIIRKVTPDDQYLITNNRGRENGWTRIVYGRVIKATNKSGNDEYVAKARPVDET